MPQQPSYSAKHRFPRIAHDTAERRGAPTWAVIGIFLILLFYFITSAAAFLMPVTLGALLFFVFVPFRRMMGRIGVSAGISAAIITLGMVLLVGGLGYAISGPISDIAENSPRITQRLEDRFQTMRENFRPLEEAAARIEKATAGGGETQEDTASPSLEKADDTGNPTVDRPVMDAEITAPAADQPQEVKVSVETERTSALEAIMASGPSIIGQIVFTLFLLFFLLASGDLLYLKVVQSFDTLSEKRAAYMAMREIEAALGSYLGAITLINAGLAVCIGGTMWLWGMPQPLLWGVAAFVLNFIPYLGAVTGVAACFLVGLVSFDDLATPIFAACSYLALTAIEGQLVTPYFVSRRLQLNTVVVFVTVALWAWLWSVLGMVVAVPILVVLKVLADHIPGLERLGNFLAGGPPPVLEEQSEMPPAEKSELPETTIIPKQSAQT
ncbi:MAG TPA: AI-2E family transporter [Paracoccus sp. (in: a-proteobacteria)]|uniref:AI-2E family transporter n=1 Tax=uncultured Paracoccus sp. TaxID=189685 RepID=UPI00262F139C|nr:AI-2E family transporter [uncultured Paracoccus sp.]HMQ39658.1 AI-2E family transporter [Paracoccus sp. (in: a-proteobacteria)]HMR34794.1 AI-2E family transporter [Paracoccus sp. (in: a-proteobacteria)]